MRPRMWLAVLGVLVVAAGAAYAAQRQFQVKPQEFAPLGTPLVQATWLQGIGCPTAARTVRPNATFTAPAGPGPNYTDPACPTGDPNDTDVEGLLLAKTGPTENFASAYAEIRNPP